MLTHKWLLSWSGAISWDISRSWSAALIYPIAQRHAFFFAGLSSCCCPFFLKNMSLCPSTSPSPPSSDSSASTASRYQSHQLPPPTLVSGLDGGIYLAAARFVEFVDFMHLFCFSHISWDAHWAYFIIAIPFYLLLCVIFTKGHFIWAWHCLSLISGTAELFSVKSS